MKITCNMKAYEAAIMDKQGKVGRKVAEGWVEIEECFRFPVVVRTYQDKETKQEKMFLSYPQRKTKNGYEDIVAPTNYQVRKEIEDCVLTEVKNCITKSVRTTPVTNVTVRILPAEENSSVLGIASATLAGGIVLNGITIRKDREGLRVLMPQYMSDGLWHDYVSASNNIIKADIEQEVVHAYRNELQKNAAVQIEPEKKSELKSPAENAEKTYSVKDFLEAYQSANVQKMMQILTTFKLKPQEAIFTNNGNAVKNHSAEYREGDYTVQVRFVNEWNPVQVTPPEKPVCQEISVYLYEKNQIRGITSLKKLKSKSLKNTAKNYEQLKAEWMKLIHVQAIEFPSNMPAVNERTYAPPEMQSPRL